MKKLLLSVALVAATGVSASAAGNVYASQLKSEGTKVSFVLNQPASKVSVQLVDGQGNVIATKDCGAGTKGVNNVNLSDLTVEDGAYAWQVVAEGDVVSEVTCLTSSKPEALYIPNIRGVAVDMWPESPYFGRVYGVSPQKPKYTIDDESVFGVFVFNADLSAYAATPFKGGVEWNGTVSPNNVKVSNNGQVFIADYGDANSGIFIMDPADPTADFKSVFSGERASNGLMTADGVSVAGSIQDFDVYGTGEGRMLYTSDEDLAGNNGEIYTYNIGLLLTPWSKAPTAAWGRNNDKVVNVNQRVFSDRRGGVWFSQYRWEEAEAYPVLSHVNAKGEWDYQTGDKSVVVGSGPGGAIAVNADGSLLAVADSGHGGGIVTIISAEFDQAGVPTLTQLYTFPYTGYGNRPLALSFDAVNNVYIAFNNDNNDGGIGVWSLPAEKNTYTTKSLAPLNFTAGIEDVTVDADADGEAEYYDLMGRKVAEPQQGRVYIERRGSKATKVVF